MRPGKGHSHSRDPSVMASERASSGRGPSQLVATSKAAPPRGASSHALGASVHGSGASQLGAAPTGEDHVDLFVGSCNFGIDQQMLQGTARI